PLALHRLLERQHYRLAFWRVASDEINYRRFFEIADLAALRTEDKAVFDATHSLVGRLAAEPGVDGLRIDHPDGLSDPEQYFERLQGLGERPWVVVEKILASYEALPAHWKVHGTTGYRFANLLTGVFIDQAAGERFERIYQRFTGERASFEEISRYSRILIMSTTLAAELAGLAQRLARIASGNRRTRDYTESGLRRALAEIAALFPVYRTYVSARGVSDTDRRYIDWAVKPRRRSERVRFREERAHARGGARPWRSSPADARVRDALPAAHRTGGGERGRGHGVLPLPQADRAERSRQRPAHLRLLAEGL